MLDAVFNILKVTVAIAVGAAFLVAINAIISLITSLIFGNVIGEVLVIISNCLPFDALAVFGALGTTTVSILAFMIAKKIFDLTSWSISSI